MLFYFALPFDHIFRFTFVTIFTFDFGLTSLFQLNGFYILSRIELHNVVNTVKLKKAKSKGQKKEDKHIISVRNILLPLFNCSQTKFTLVNTKQFH